MKLFPVLLIAICAGAATAQDAGDRPRVRHPPVANTWVEHQSWMSVNERRDWRGWLAKNYPDGSASWSADCAKTLDAQGWDFVAKGDFNKNGIPTALKVRFAPAAAGAKGRMVVGFSIAECRDGAWAEILGLDAKKGLWANGVELKGLRLAALRGFGVSLATGIKASPGLQVVAKALNEKGGGISEGVDFTYDPESKKYDAAAR